MNRYPTWLNMLVLVFLLTGILWDSGRRQEALTLLKETGEKREKTDFFWGVLANWEVRNDRLEDGARHARKFLKGASKEGRRALAMSTTRPSNR